MNNNISMNSWPADGVLEFAVTQPAGVKASVVR